MAVGIGAGVSLSEILGEVSGESSQSLSAAFAAANSSDFDIGYAIGGVDAMSEFQNYDESATPTMILSPTSLVAFSSTVASADTQQVTLTSNTSWSVGILPSWLSVSPTSGTGSTTLDVTVDEDNNTGSQRSDSFSVSTTSGTPTATDSVFVTQLSGFE